jgi:hypothetical protein
MKNKAARALLVIVTVTIACSAIFSSTGCHKEVQTKTVYDSISVVTHDTLYKRDTLYKVDTIDYDNKCPLRGLYVGTNTQSNGAQSNSIYTFYDNHFAIGQETLNGPATSWSGFRNTCDSVIMSVYYITNNTYYLLKGKISNDRNTISGSYMTSDGMYYGVFTMSK